MYLYSIMPLVEDHFEERCLDIIEQVKTGAATCPMFFMHLVPEGKPPLDKVGSECEKYIRYRDRLAKDGVKCGILVQASFGHGYPLDEEYPFQPMIQLTDGEPAFTACPIDERYQDYIRNVFRRLAQLHPEAIMIDDDVRLMNRPGRGCVCEKHMAEFNRRTGLHMDRQQLYDYIMAHPDDDPVTRTYVDWEMESVTYAVKAMREGIDSVDPSIQGVCCMSSPLSQGIVGTSTNIAGAGNLKIVRLPNGTYAPSSVLGFSSILMRTAATKETLKDKIDVVLAETDTIMFNRYSKSAAYLNAQFTSSLLDGVQGAKHWITRLYGFEPESGKAFRKTLSTHRGLYERLTQLAKEIKWTGCRIPVYKENIFSFHDSNYPPDAWAECVLERLGLPFYFACDNGGVTCLSGDVDKYMTDAELSKAFEGMVFIASDTAKRLISRGFGDKLGVDVKEWNGANISNECLPNGLSYSKQVNAMELIPKNDKVETLAYCFHTYRDEQRFLFPAVTKYDRGNGAVSVVFCGTPKAKHTYLEAFSFLNETRKKQLATLMSEAGMLPVYYPGDAQMLLRAGTIADGRLLCIMINTGMDVLDELPLVLEKKPESIVKLMPDGSEKAVTFTGDGTEVTVDIEIPVMNPVILLIK